MTGCHRRLDIGDMELNGTGRLCWRAHAVISELEDAIVHGVYLTIFRGARLVLAALVLQFIGFASAPVMAESYTLDTGDALRIAIFGEPAFPLDTMIDDRGRISLPLLGDVEARGVTPADLAQRIRKAFQEQKLLIDPFVQVEVREYRPFFISGAVAQPGPYPYKPGITVRHALAIAGGFKVQTIDNQAPALRIADLRSERANLLIDEYRQRTRIERLRAESLDQDTFKAPLERPMEIPANLLDDIVMAEKHQLMARQGAYRSDIRHLEDSLVRAKKDEELLDTARKERENAAKFQLQQLEASRKLQKKGLATNTNLLTAERTQNSYQIDLAEANVNQAKVRQEIMDLENELRGKKGVRKLNLVTELEQEQLAFAKTQSALRYVNDKLLYVSIYGEQRTFDDLQGAVRVVIYRKGSEQNGPIEAKEDTDVQAGDIIDVSIRASQQFYEVNPSSVGN
jgi:polysaccharide biosynthesis/export protein